MDLAQEFAPHLLVNPSRVQLQPFAIVRLEPGYSLRQQPPVAGLERAIGLVHARQTFSRHRVFQLRISQGQLP
jgi:hypothetical protein